MDIKESIQDILYLIITGILPLLITYVIVFLRTKIKEYQSVLANENINKYIDIATEAISIAVMTVSQTYVDGLKKIGKFDEIAQETAKQMAIEKAKELINEQSKAAIELLYNDFELYLNNQIEALVRKDKIATKENIVTV